MSDESNTATKAKPTPAEPNETTNGVADRYELPFVGVHVLAAAVNAGFWGGLVGAAALGAIAPPVAIAVGAGVVIARHRANPSAGPDNK